MNHWATTWLRNLITTNTDVILDKFSSKHG